MRLLGKTKLCVGIAALLCLCSNVAQADPLLVHNRDPNGPDPWLVDRSELAARYRSTYDRGQSDWVVRAASDEEAQRYGRILLNNWIFERTFQYLSARPLARPVVIVPVPASVFSPTGRRIGGLTTQFADRTGTVVLLNSDYIGESDTELIHVATHELFHAGQDGVAETPMSTGWFIEGTAEWWNFTRGNLSHEYVTQREADFLQRSWVGLQNGDEGIWYGSFFFVHWLELRFRAERRDFLAFLRSTFRQIGRYADGSRRQSDLVRATLVQYGFNLEAELAYFRAAHRWPVPLNGGRGDFTRFRIYPGITTRVLSSEELATENVRFVLGFDMTGCVEFSIPTLANGDRLAASYQRPEMADDPAGRQVEDWSTARTVRFDLGTVSAAQRWPEDGVQLAYVHGSSPAADRGLIDYDGGEISLQVTVTRDPCPPDQDSDGTRTAIDLMRLHTNRGTTSEHQANRESGSRRGGVMLTPQVATGSGSDDAESNRPGNTGSGGTRVRVVIEEEPSHGGEEEGQELEREPGGRGRAHRRQATGNTVELPSCPGVYGRVHDIRPLPGRRRPSRTQLNRWLGALARSGHGWNSMLELRPNGAPVTVSEGMRAADPVWGDAFQALRARMNAVLFYPNPSDGLIRGAADRTVLDDSGSPVRLEYVAAADGARHYTGRIINLRGEPVWQLHEQGNSGVVVNLAPSGIGSVRPARDIQSGELVHPGLQPVSSWVRADGRTPLGLMTDAGDGFRLYGADRQPLVDDRGRALYLGDEGQIVDQLGQVRSLPSSTGPGLRLPPTPQQPSAGERSHPTLPGIVVPVLPGGAFGGAGAGGTEGESGLQFLLELLRYGRLLHSFNMRCPRPQQPVACTASTARLLARIALACPSDRPTPKPEPEATPSPQQPCGDGTADCFVWLGCKLSPQYCPDLTAVVPTVVGQSARMRRG